MSDERYQEALATAQKLTTYSEDTLYEELGLRIQDMQNIGGYERSQHYAADFAQVAEDMLSTEDLKEIGRRWWKKLEPSLMDLVCKQNNPELGKVTSGKTIPQIAASLATMALLASLAPPSWVIVATSIMATKIAEAGLDALCEVWGESLMRGKPKS